MGGRVLFVTGEYPPMHGGIGDYTARLADVLAEQGWESFVVTSRSIADASNAAADGASANVVATVDRWDRRIQPVIRQALDETDADILHIQYQTGAFQMRPSINLLPLRLGARRRPVPVVTTFHDLLWPYLFPKAGRLRRWANRMLVLGSDAVVLTNERDFQQVNRFGRFRNRTHHIPIGSNIPRATNVDRDAVLRRHGLDPAGFVVGFFGFLTADKGIDDLLDALERPDMHGTQLFVISGELATTDATNRRYRERIQQHFEEAKIPVHVTGYLSPHDAAEAMVAADVLAIPFRSGASLRSGTLIAALQSGTPVITTDPRPGDTLAPLSPGESVWLVPISDPDVLHDAVQLLRQEPSLRRRLATNARAASCAFSWEAIAERHRDLYCRLLE